MNISIENISFSYKDGKGKREIFKNFSIKIASGEFVIVLGPSGCGKSTLLNIIGGLLSPESGRVMLNNTPYYELSSKEKDSFRRKHIGYVFQNFYLAEDLSPMDNVMLTMSDKLSLSEKRQRIREIVSELGIEEKINSPIRTYSGGEQQRLAIARAIAQEGSLLICDEPTGSLDEDNTIQIMEILKKLNKQGKTIVMVTHNRELCTYATTVLELNQKLREEGHINEANN